MVDQLSSFADEVTRVAREVGTEGMLGGQAQVRASSGTWRDLTENVNSMASNLTDQVRNIAEVDDRGRERRPLAKITVDVQGRDARARRTPSTRWSTSCTPSPPRSRASRARSAPRASSAARRRSRRRRHVEGPDRQRELHGDEPDRPGAQHRATSRPRSRTATCRKKITVDVQGRDPRAEEHDQHDGRPARAFAAEVTRVAREVGTEGKLGGQADVPASPARGRT